MSLAMVGTLLLSGCSHVGGSQLNPALLGSEEEMEAKDNCGAGSAGFDSMNSKGSDATLSEEQNKVAQAIVGEGERRHLPAIAKQIAIMTALAESTLQNLDHGDEAQGVKNPDGSATTSKGAFQQQDFWGPEKVRMDPAGAAGLFYDKLTALDYQSMDPGAAAQEVQGSAFPDRYNEFREQAKKIVASMDKGGYDKGPGGKKPDTADGGKKDAAGPVSDPASPALPALASTPQVGPSVPGIVLAADVRTVEDSKANGKVQSAEHLQQDAFNLAKAAEKQFPELETIGGWRESDPFPDHPSGQAVDIMIPDPTSDKGRALGNEINHWVWKNKDAFNVTYTIWRQTLYSDGAESGKPMEDRGGDTANHVDHVHVTTKGGGKNNGQAGSAPARDGDGASKDADDKSVTSGSCAANSAGGAPGQGATAGSGKGDDYPKELHQPKAAVDAANASQGQNEPGEPVDPWGLVSGQCVSWVAWRINVSMGYDPKKDGDKYPFTMAKYGVQGQGNGFQWKASMAKAGFKTDNKPKPGSVAWWDANVAPAGPMGHVGIVEKVEGNRVYVSQYNAYPRYLEYSEQWFEADKISGFIHVADYPEGKHRIEAPKAS